MLLNAQTISAEIYNYDPVRERYYVKLKFHQAYICGIVVQPSIQNPGKYMINMPSYKRGLGWAHYIEFEKTSPLKALIEDKALNAVLAYKSGEAGSGHDEIDLEQLPF